MRARNLKPGFFKNEQLAELPPEARLLFAGLWCMADRDGLLEDRPKRIKMELFPADSFDVDDLLAKLHNHGLIERYESGGIRCIAVIEFRKHQHPHQKEPPSTLPKPGACPVPAPDATGAGTSAARLNPSSLNPESPLLNPDSAPAGRIASAREKPDPRETFLECRRRYPGGLHRGDHWLHAEREIYRRLEEGEPPELLIANTDAYRQQQEATGTIGTEKVKRPSNFYVRDGAWRGPFPMPKSKAETRQASNISAAEQWLEESSRAAG